MDQLVEELFQGLEIDDDGDKFNYVIKKSSALKILDVIEIPPETKRYETIKVGLVRAYKTATDAETLTTQNTKLRICSLHEKMPADSDKKEKIAGNKMKLSNHSNKEANHGSPTKVGRTNRI